MNQNDNDLFTIPKKSFIYNSPSWISYGQAPRMPFDWSVSTYHVRSRNVLIYYVRQNNIYGIFVWIPTVQNYFQFSSLPCLSRRFIHTTSNSGERSHVNSFVFASWRAPSLQGEGQITKIQQRRWSSDPASPLFRLQFRHFRVLCLYSTNSVIVLKKLFLESHGLRELSA